MPLNKVVYCAQSSVFPLRTKNTWNDGTAHAIFITIWKQSVKKYFIRTRARLHSWGKNSDLIKVSVKKFFLIKHTEQKSRHRLFANLGTTTRRAYSYRLLYIINITFLWFIVTSSFFTPHRTIYGKIFFSVNIRIKKIIHMPLFRPYC